MFLIFVNKVLLQFVKTYSLLLYRLLLIGLNFLNSENIKISTRISIPVPVSIKVRIRQLRICIFLNIGEIFLERL